MRALLPLFAVFACFALGPAQSQSAVRVDMPQAAQIAVNDFGARLAKERDQSELGRYLGDIHNYDIGMRESNDAYFIRFALKPRPGRRIFGGGGEYKIKKGSLEIVRFNGYE